MASCLVTGGGGFLGQYIVEQLLARGDQVRSISRTRYRALDELGVEHVQGDIRDAEVVLKACKDVEVVFHTAAIASIWGRWEKFHSINTLGSENILSACREQGVQRLVPKWLPRNGRPKIHSSRST